MDQPQPRLSFSFGLFKQTSLQFLQQKIPSSLQCWDSNPRPSVHESPPTTTRPGLPPINTNYLLGFHHKGTIVFVSQQRPTYAWVIKTPIHTLDGEGSIPVWLTCLDLTKQVKLMRGAWPLTGDEGLYLPKW